MFISNRLTLNINKTCYMLFNNKLSHINISINNINLTRVKSTEFLGIIIDENLDWKLHILYLKNKLKKIIWITNIISKFVNQKALLHVYNSIFLPHIKYCIILWGNTYKTNILCINILQKRIIRIIHNKPYLYHTKDLFKFNNILPFNNLVKYNTCEFMFKVYNNVHREIIINHFSKKSIISPIRDINNFNIPSTKLNICSHCLIIIGHYLWNSLCNSN